LLTILSDGSTPGHPRARGSAAVAALRSGEDVEVLAEEALARRFGIHAVPPSCSIPQDAASGVVPVAELAGITERTE
jgi:hypothetical protein